MGARLRSAVVLLTIIVGGVAPSQDRVPFKDVTALTFRAGAHTTGRRLAPIPQARCRGRSCSRFTPAVIQCLRTGWDGRDATWRCEADLPRGLQFGDVTISCEGYSYPDDPFILAGSCGLTYQLVEVGAGPSKNNDNYGKGDSSFGITLFGLFLLIIFAFVMFSFCRAGRWSGGNDDGSSSSPPPPPPYNNYHRMPNFGQSMPSASASCNPPPTSSSSGLGFWSGLGVGALTGYAFGHRHRGNHATAAPVDGWGWGRSRSPRPTTTSEGTRTAFGYATTERR